MKTERIFISYARSDGENFAKILREKLIEEFSEDAIWRDREKMEGGRSWWKQIEEALNTVQFMVLVATPNAMESDTVKDELRLARNNGVCVYPIQDPTQPLVFDKLPQWIRGLHFHDIDKEWETFVNHLKNPCYVERVPFMARRLEDVIVRVRLIHNIVEKLVDKKGNAISTTISLVGTAGFGKTTLAQQLCVHDKISDAFFDGILWVSLGQRPDTMKEIRKIYKALTNKDEVFIDEDEGARFLSEVLRKKTCLIVIDDVWNHNDILPFLRKSDDYKSAVIITSRSHFIGEEIPIVEMDEEDAIQLLRYDMDGISEQQLRDLSKQLGHWVIMLKIIHSAMLTYKKQRQKSSQEALNYINKKIKKGGVTSFNPDDISNLLKPSVDLLNNNGQRRLFELGILVGDIPISSIALLWGIDDDQTEEQLIEFSKLSLIKFSADNIIIHKVIREYLAGQLTDASAIHQKFLDGYSVAHWHDLPDNDPYLWHNIAYHLIESGRITDLYPLITNFRWLQAKLNATKDPAYLIADCDLWLDEHGKDDATYETVRLIRSALANASHILINDFSALAHQLAGRLFRHRKKHKDIESFITTINPPQGTLYPIDNGYDVLIPAGGMLIATMDKHENKIVGAMKEGNYIISWDKSEKLCLWDADAKLIDGPKETLDLPDGMQVTVHLGQLYINDELKSHTPSDDSAVTLSDGRRVSWKDDFMFIDGQKIFIGNDTHGVIEVSKNRFISWTSKPVLLLWDMNVEHIEIQTEHELGFPIAKLDFSDDNIVSINNKEIAENNKMAVLWKKQGEDNKINFVPEKIENYEDNSSEDEDDRNQSEIIIEIRDSVFIRSDGKGVLFVEKGSEIESQTIARFYGSSGFKEITVSDGVVVAGDTVGRVLFLRWIE